MSDDQPDRRDDPSAPDRLERLEGELCSWSARMAAATCRFLETVAQYDRIEGWRRWECHDMAQWLSWKCGLAPSTSREYVRVGRALEAYPSVRAGFAAGRLSYSQARAITRVGIPEMEAQLVELAPECTGAQFERIVAGLRRSEQAEREKETGRDQGRFLRWGWDDDGCLCGTFRLPPETGALLAAAVDAMVTAASVADADADSAREPRPAARADALVGLVSAGAHADPDATGGEYLVTVLVDQPVLGAGDAAAAAGSMAPAADGGSGTGPAAATGTCCLESGPALAGETARRIACDSGTVEVAQGPGGSVLDVGRRTRRVSRRIRQALLRRDGGCQFPGCNRPGAQAHHIRHWAHGGATSLANLVLLCWRHHHRVHEGGYTVSVGADGRFEFRHPSGWVIRPGAPPVGDGTDDGDLGVGPYRSDWDGSRLDLPLAVEMIMHNTRLRTDSASAESGSAEFGSTTTFEE